MRNWIIAGIIMIASGLDAQDYQSRIYQTYLDGRMDLWKKVMGDMQSEYERTADLSLLYALTEAQYGYIAFCLSENRKKEATTLLDAAEINIEKLLEGGKENARTYSLKGALYGFRIQLKPLKAPFLGKKSVEANDMAAQLGPGEPQVWMEKANIEFYKPAAFGGSKKEAVVLYEKAINLFESSPGRQYQNWLYLNCLASLAMAYEETDQVQAAEGIYKKILLAEPSFKWISEEVYPQFKEKHPGN